VVIKADGLAAGKGVIICHDADEARQAVDRTMVAKAFGRAGDRVVVEEFLSGTEATIMALCDGDNALPLLPSQDHKPAFDGDEGPNTGGMGAFAPATNVVDDELVERVRKEILQPTIAGLAGEDRVFRGLLYAGLMIDEEGPKVLEYNCRFGDPETQAILPLLDEDLGELLLRIADEESIDHELSWRAGSAACVIVAAEGYPGKARSGDPISGLETLDGRDDVIVFHSGTSCDNSQMVTAGGRVLGITGIGDDLDAALANAYDGVSKISFPGMHFRSDIGRRGRES
jgi:phosphoribosylamine--glycine ligase